MSAKISVCIPTYNGGRYIKEQMDSILSQLGKDDEVIISDDRSTDDTIKILESYADRRVKIYTHERIHNPHNGSYTTIYYVNKNVENALRYASGEYIFLSDQDDIWLPNKVERVMSDLRSGVDCVLHNAIVTNQDNEPILDSFFTISRPSCSWLRFFTFNFYQGASMAFNRKILELTIPFSNSHPIGHDHWISCFVWSHGKRISFIDEPLLLYRRHGENVSPNVEGSKNSLYFKISYRFHLFWCYLIALRRQY